MASLNFPEDFLWNETALAELLHGANGGVAHDLSVRAIRVESAAKQIATGPARPPARDGGPGVVSGRLRASISWRINVDSLGMYADIGTGVPYGYYLETGLVNGATYPFLRPALPAAAF